MLRDWTKTAATRAWDLSFWGVRQATAPFTPAGSGEQPRALDTVRRFGESLITTSIDLAAGLLSPQILEPANLLRVTGDPVERTTETLDLLLSGGDLEMVGRELANKGEIFLLVAAVNGLIGVPERPPLPLPELAARCYALGGFGALWAIEGLGHVYGDSAWEQGVRPRDLLSPAVTAGLPPGSLLMMHAGIGLSIAKQLLDRLTCDVTDAKLLRTVADIGRLNEENSLPGHLGAAHESLGLVTRTFHPTLVARIDRILCDWPARRGYFWHGVGRAIYFWMTNFLPCSDWQIFAMAQREAPDEEARRNAFAGLAWAFTLVNQRQPRVMAELLLRRYAAELGRDDAFVNGVASALMMRQDTSPDAPFIAAFLAYQPSDAAVAASWERLVRAPGTAALTRIYPVLRRERRLGEMFRYRPLADLEAGR